MKIRFKNARILTMADGDTVIEGELHVDGNRVSYVGDKKEEFDNEKWDKVIDAKGNLLMPGFKNAHTHSAMTFLRTFAEDVPLHTWLHEKVFPMEAKLLPEDVYPLSILAIMEYLTSGITANFDMYMFPMMVAKASADTGFRTVLCGSANDFGGSAQSLKNEYETLNNYHELIRYQLGFHAEYTTAKELMLDISNLAEELKAPVYVHNSETEEEVAGCIERYGMTPTVFMDSMGMFRYGGGGFHCVHMSEEDLMLFQNKGLYVVSNPGSNCKLASGIAPITQMLERNICISLGTDGPASNNCLDMFKEMFLVTGLQKVSRKDATAVNSFDVLKMATTNGAKAMGLHDCDTIEEGKLADIIMIDLQQPNMQPLNDIPKNIVYSGSKINVAMTMVNGKILYEKGNFYIGVKAEDIYEQANAIINRMKEA